VTFQLVKLASPGQDYQITAENFTSPLYILYANLKAVVHKSCDKTRLYIRWNDGERYASQKSFNFSCSHVYQLIQVIE